MFLVFRPAVCFGVSRAPGKSPTVCFGVSRAPGKSPTICFDVSRASKFNTRYVLAISESRDLTFVMF